MHGDPLRHLVVPRLGGGDVVDGTARAGGEGFGKARLAGARAAEDEDERQAHARSRVAPPEGGCYIAPSRARLPR